MIRVEPYQHDGRQNEDDNIGRKAGECLSDDLVEDVKQATRKDTLPKGNSTHGKEDNRPGKFLEVILR